jgi:hypothetical protein
MHERHPCGEWACLRWVASWPYKRECCAVPHGQTILPHFICAYQLNSIAFSGPCIISAGSPV